MKERGMVEKPRPEAAPSRMAVIGRYILTPAVLENLETIRAGAGGEIQLTDAIAAEIGARGDVHAFRFHGRRFDCGSKAGYLQATVAFGLARPDLREEFLAYLREVCAEELTPPAPLRAVKA
jgi:UTP--glucose-1-phosphate uridylyltransferase